MDKMDKMLNLLEKQGEAINQVNQKVEKQGEAINQVNQKVEKQGEAINQVNQKVEKQGEAINQVNQKVEKQGEAINQVDQKVDRLEARTAEQGEYIQALLEGQAKLSQDFEEMKTNFIKINDRLDTAVIDIHKNKTDIRHLKHVANEN